MKCPKCGYEWESKVPNPKECPRCKGRLDYVPGPVGAPKVWKKKEVEKMMTRRLPLVAAAIIIVAAVGAWAILGGTPVTPSAGGWTSTSVLGFTGGQKSGIAAVYIAKPGQDFDENWIAVATYPENYYLVHTDTGGTGDIPYDTDFVILVEVVGHDDNMVAINLDNIKVELSLTGTLVKSAENTNGGDGQEFQFAISGSEIGVNAVWDNDGNYFRLPADTSFNYTVKLWTYG